MDAFWNEYHFWMLAESVSQSMFYRVFNAVSDPCFKRKCLMDDGEIILHLKRIYIMHQASVWRARNIAHENDYAAVTLIGMTLNFTFSWMRGNWYVLQTAQGHHFVHDFWKRFHESYVSAAWCTHAPKVSARHKICVPEFPILSAHKLPSCGLVVNTYIITEERDFKRFLKENYTIALDGCYLFTKKMLNVEKNMILIVLMEFPFIRHSWT